MSRREKLEKILEAIEEDGNCWSRVSQAVAIVRAAADGCDEICDCPTSKAIQAMVDYEGDA